MLRVKCDLNSQLAGLAHYWVENIMNWNLWANLSNISNNTRITVCFFFENALSHPGNRTKFYGRGHSAAMLRKSAHALYEPSNSPFHA